MSRIGKKPVPLGAAKVTVADKLIKVEGPKGKLELKVHPLIKVEFNMVEGVIKGYRKDMEIIGVGYKAEQKGKTLLLSVGYANAISVPIPAGLNVVLEGPTKVQISGPDKQMVGQFASDLRRVRKPEPYKGKGIRYQGEVVKIKPGKAFAGAGAAK